MAHIMARGERAAHFDSWLSREVVDFMRTFGPKGRSAAEVVTVANSARARAVALEMRGGHGHGMIVNGDESGRGKGAQGLDIWIDLGDRVWAGQNKVHHRPIKVASRRAIMGMLGDRKGLPTVNLPPCGTHTEDAHRAQVVWAARNGWMINAITVHEDVVHCLSVDVGAAIRGLILDSTGTERPGWVLDDRTGASTSAAGMEKVTPLYTRRVSRKGTKEEYLEMRVNLRAVAPGFVKEYWGSREMFPAWYATHGGVAY